MAKKRKSAGAIGQELVSRLGRLDDRAFSSLDLLPGRTMEEKLLRLSLQGPPQGLGLDALAADFRVLAELFQSWPTEDVRVVVFGGGTGLSNIIGGDSRNPSWPADPFGGLKRHFPQLTSVVCVTDDGGSTGELLKDLPFIALGDIRHVLLSSVREEKLQELTAGTRLKPEQVAAALFELLNLRLATAPCDVRALAAGCGSVWSRLPRASAAFFRKHLALLAPDGPLGFLTRRRHCLGNLLLAAAIARCHKVLQGQWPTPESSFSSQAVLGGIAAFGQVIGAGADAVFPCTTTPSRLQVLYGNGVLVTGESKSAEADRGAPVERVMTAFAGPPEVPAEVFDSIRAADIIVFAPGSLFTSVIPIFRVPGLAQAVRKNRAAMKILVANIWVQKGETDVVRGAPGRRYWATDLVRSYDANIEGGVAGMFSHVLALGMRDIPGSILQRYAVEDKTPIYLDRERLESAGFTAIEAGIYSQRALKERRVIQHDPLVLSRALRVLWSLRACGGGADTNDAAIVAPNNPVPRPLARAWHGASCLRYARMARRLDAIRILRAGDGEATEASMVRERVLDILWRQADVDEAHLDLVDALVLHPEKTWRRAQEWDNIFSFYDPAAEAICIREDMLADIGQFEMVFLVALGQSLLGSYAQKKEIFPLSHQGSDVGKLYSLRLRPVEKRRCYLGEADLAHYLELARMLPSAVDSLLYTRAINGREGFTPPGLLFGLFYAWYLDNRFATHIEYKMALLRHQVSALVPEQMRARNLRSAMVDFFRQRVFGHSL